jgi:hypothetical protein
MNTKNINNGRWTEEEHKKFLEACIAFGNNWKKVIFLIRSKIILRQDLLLKYVPIVRNISLNSIRNIKYLLRQ